MHSMDRQAGTSHPAPASEPRANGVASGEGATQPTAADSRVVEATITGRASRAWAYGAGALIVAGVLFANNLLFAMGLFLAAALGLAFVWARLCLRNLSVSRSFGETRAFWGEEIDIAQVFTNDKLLPVPWLAIEDEFPDALEVTSEGVAYMYKPYRRVLTTTISLNWYQRVTRHYKVKCTARGEYEFGPIDVQSGDLFGFFRRTEVRETPQTLIVYPRYVPVERLGIPARQPFGDFKAVLHLATDPLRLRGLREYEYGDSPRFIHWKATARRGVLQTKLFEPAATPQLLIFCNQDTHSHIWEGIARETLELTITAAASIANYALEAGYMVGLEVNAFTPSSDGHIKLLPGRSPDQFTRILESLAIVRDWSGVPMEELLRAQFRFMPESATVVLVTGLITDELLDVLVALRRAGHPVTLVETIGPDRLKEKTQARSYEALHAEGITYYLVDAIDRASEIDELFLSPR